LDSDLELHSPSREEHSISEDQQEGIPRKRQRTELFNPSAVPKKDLFRSRKSNSSRPPSIHVDEFVKTALSPTTMIPEKPVAVSDPDKDKNRSGMTTISKPLERDKARRWDDGRRNVFTERDDFRWAPPIDPYAAHRNGYNYHERFYSRDRYYDDRFSPYPRRGAYHDSRFIVHFS
jgi:hypothetical protein